MLGHSGQSRIGERHRAGRARGEPKPPAERRPKTRGAPTESPSRAGEANNSFARRRRMASPGPAPPCVQARETSRTAGAAEPPTGPAVLTGERVSPRAPPQAVPLWYGTATAAAPLSRGSAPEGAVATARAARRPPFTFIAPLGLVRPMTRTHVRLLGPCFKTGRVGHRPFARRERYYGPQGPLCCTTVAGQPGHRRFPPSPARRRDVGVPIQPGLRRPQQRVAATYITRGNTPAGAGSNAGTPKSAWVASANPAPGRPEPTS